MKEQMRWVVVCCVLFGLLSVSVHAEQPVIALLAEFVSMTDKAIVIKHNDQEKRFTITADTKFIDDNGNVVSPDSLSLKKGDDVSVTTEIDGFAALSVRKGGMPIGF